MQDKFNQFFLKYNGQPVEAEDPTNYAQCFDLAFAWVDALDIPRDTIRHLDAFQIYTNPNPDTLNYFDIIVNTPSDIPQTGDLIVWGQTVGQAGHVAVCSPTADVNSFTSFDQNWDSKQYARLVTHSYNGVLGFLRAKVIESTQVTLNMPQYFETLLQENSLNINDESQIRAFFQQAISFPSCYTDKLNAQTDLATANNKISDITSANKQQADMIASLQKQLSNAQNATKNGSTAGQSPIYPNATTVQSGSFLGWLKSLLGI